MSKNPFKTHLQTSMGKPNLNKVSWNGTGVHPILGLTREEILSANEFVSDKHADDKVDSKEKTAQPTEDEAVRVAREDAKYKQELAIEILSLELSARKS